MKKTRVQQKGQERAQTGRQVWTRHQEAIITRAWEREIMKVQELIMRKVKVNRGKTYALLAFQSQQFKNSE